MCDLSAKLDVSPVRIPALPPVRRQLCSGNLSSALDADSSTSTGNDVDNNWSDMVGRLAPTSTLRQSIVPAAANDERNVFIE